LGELGWLMAGIPEELGGLGSGPGDLAIIAGELAAGLVLEPYLGCAVVAARALVGSSVIGRNDLRALLEAMMDASQVLALADDDAADAPVQAERRSRGHRLTGRKLMVLGGPIADHFLVSGRSSRDGAERLFLVPSDAAGLTRIDFRLIDRSIASELTLDSVDVDDDMMIASDGEAVDAARDLGVVIASAAAVGAADAVLWQTRDYLKTRRQFGVELASFQALQHRMADMYIALEQSRSILFHGLDGVGHADCDVRRRATSATRIVTAKAARFVASQAVQLHGGIGTTEELPAGRYFQHVTVLTSLFGGVDHHVRRFGALMQADESITL
jgi:alkylation response protein AidB-like acyl-CoA dehydrogenase